MWADNKLAIWGLRKNQELILGSPHEALLGSIVRAPSLYKGPIWGMSRSKPETGKPPVLYTGFSTSLWRGNSEIYQLLFHMVRLFLFNPTDFSACILHGGFSHSVFASIYRLSGLGFWNEG